MISYLTGGESHGPQLTAILDGIPAGLKIDPGQLQFQLDRRRKGYGRGGRMAIESDIVEIASGVRHGVTIGSPITLVIRNRDWPNWQDIMDPLNPPPPDLGLRERRLHEQTTAPRPGHADLAGGIKYDHHDLRNVLERASARETAARTAVGAVCRQLLETFNTEFASHVVQIGTVELASPYDITSLAIVRETTENSEVRCLDAQTGARMIDEIKSARSGRDSVGGIVEIIVRGLPVGLGSYAQAGERLDGLLAGAMMSIPSVKAVELGLGFRGASRRGSEFHDEVQYRAGSSPTKKDFSRHSNNAGGIEGGVSNGEDLVIRIAAKPISTLNRPLRTVDVVTHEAREAMVERTDHCIVPALGVIAEAVAAIVIAQAFTRKFGGDNMTELTRHYQSWLEASY